MPLFCSNGKIDAIGILKQHCKSRPFRQAEGVLGSNSVVESEDTKVKYVAAEEEINGSKDFIRKVNLLSDEYDISWVMDGDMQACMLCSSQFNVFLRRHHCRACGAVICWSCFADSKIKIKALKQHERSSIACYKCFDQLKLVHSEQTEKNIRREAATIPTDDDNSSSRKVSADPPVARSSSNNPTSFASSNPGGPPPSTAKKPSVTAVILNDANSLGTPETRQAILQGAIKNIVWESDDISTPGSTAHISPQPAGGGNNPSCFWDDSVDTPEPSTPATTMGSAASEKYFYTPGSAAATPVSFTPLVSSSLQTHNKAGAVTSSKAILLAATTGVWQPPADSPSPEVRHHASIRSTTSQRQKSDEFVPQNQNHQPKNTKNSDTDGGDTFQPATGFSLKVNVNSEGISTVGTNSAIVRVFINVCQHESIPEFQSKNKSIHTCVGPSHQAIDDSGILLCGYDVAIASSHVSAAFLDEGGDTLKRICETVIAAVATTHDVSLSKDFKLARTSTGYLGKQPPMRMKCA